MPVGCYIGRVKEMVEQRRAVRRADGRRPAELRPVRLVPGFLPPAEGSVLIETGATRVICTATVQDGVPPFLRGQGRGWVTAEYGMLPRSSGERIERERRGPGGGTRTAAVTGGYVALALALERLRAAGVVAALPLTGTVAGVSAGIVDGRQLLDLAYEEDHRAEVDLNVVMTGAGRLVEVQGTAEGKPFTLAQLERLLDLAAGGIRTLTALQRETLAGAGVTLPRRA